MKTAIILGRGIEGCGVTRCAIETAKVLSADIFATSDRPWPRRKLTGYNKFIEFGAFNGEKVREVTKTINENYDIVLLFSVPAVKGFLDIALNNFVNMIGRITVPKVALQFDHNIQSIHRNANFSQILEMCDVILTHSLCNDFSEWVREQGIQVDLQKMSLGFNFDEHRKKYWKDIHQQNSNLVRWIGRFAGWKNPQLMIEFHNRHLRNSGFITILEGLEANISYAELLKTDVVNKFRPRKELAENSEFIHGEEKCGTGPYLYPPYDHDQCMERLSLSAYGSDLYQLKIKQYGNNIENCHAEVVASGSIPIFHNHFGTYVIHRKTGDPVNKSKNSGTIWLNDEAPSMIDACELMIKLSKDSVMRDEWREMAFEFWKSHADISNVAEEIQKIYAYL